MKNKLNKEQFIKNFEYLKNVNNLTYDDIAAALKISRPSILAFKNGKTLPSFDTMILISKFFHVSL